MATTTITTTTTTTAAPASPHSSAFSGSRASAHSDNSHVAQRKEEKKKPSTLKSRGASECGGVIRLPEETEDVVSYQSGEARFICKEYT
ncbi:Hypothetical predicted protein [Xyrichtys novacula]|uniref:Uncharacterized protein n=1 Tax=Xyrichtys novacula TaxID=13765 RepID=A0AAV1H2M0_XYRNO|nr:Hypothetical predicted protein [Xyrichtys novacula]